MELVNWSLNAIDRIFSTRSSGSGEPACPDGTFAAGYVRDSWEKWRVVCLAILSVEDIEDLYIFGTMITGFLLIGSGIFLVYRKLGNTGTAVQSPMKLPGMYDGVSRAVSAQTVGTYRNTENTWEGAVSAQSAAFNRNMVNILDRAVAAQSVVINRYMENILEKLVALQRRMEQIEDQIGQRV